MSSTPCPKCSNLRTDSSVIRDETTKTGKRKAISIGEIEASYRQGCETCGILYRGIESACPDLLHDEDWKAIPARFRGGQTFTIRFPIDELGGANRMIEWFTTGRKKTHQLYPAIKTRPRLEADLSSKASLSFMRKLLKQCRRKHAACNLYAKSALFPTRILDIGTKDDSKPATAQRAPIRLAETRREPVRGRYVCLSHRWGAPEHTPKTTKATLEARKAGIAFSELSRVFQDTVHVLRKLGIRYLWIDSFCIIQDSPEDWEVEAANMADIYSRALFTLAMQNDDSFTNSITCGTRDYELVTGKQPVFARQYIDQLSLRAWSSPGNSALFPLHSRGWIYQERLLSSRIIHFTSQQVVWECNEICASQSNDDSSTVHFKAQHARAMRLGSSNNILRNNLEMRWHRLVTEYTALQLTYASDRLAALQGCATQMASAIKSEYLFGLWEDTVLEGFLWHVNERECRLRERTKGLEVPTWSWASVPVPVQYLDVQGMGAAGGKDIYARFVGKSPLCGDANRCLVIAGQMVPAWLVVKPREVAHQRESKLDNPALHVVMPITRLLEQTQILHTSKETFEPEIEERNAGFDEDVFWPDIDPTLQLDDRRVEPVHVFRLACVDNGTRADFSLVLRQIASERSVERRGIFERLGVLITWEKDTGIDWEKADWKEILLT